MTVRQLYLVLPLSDNDCPGADGEWRLEKIFVLPQADVRIGLKSLSLLQFIACFFFTFDPPTVEALERFFHHLSLASC